jgi:hypothetical protein
MNNETVKVFPSQYEGADRNEDSGMDLRDWFAGQALAGLLADGRAPESAPASAYWIADAMMTERKKNG